MKKFKLLLPLICLLWPSGAFASEVETKLYQSCANSRGPGNAASLCSCKAKKWASQRVQSIENPSTYFRISDRFVNSLQQNWYAPEFSQASNLNGDDAIMAMLSMYIRKSCAEQQEIPVLQSRMPLN